MKFQDIDTLARVFPWAMISALAVIAGSAHFNPSPEQLVYLCLCLVVILVALWPTVSTLIQGFLFLGQDRGLAPGDRQGNGGKGGA